MTSNMVAKEGVGQRAGIWSLAALLLSFAAYGCENDELTVAPTFMGDDCEDVTQCNEGGHRLDAGVVGGGDPDSGPTTVPDSGAAEVDAGGPVGGTPDASVFDAGTPDSGVPPSRFLNLAGTWHTEYLFDLSDYLFGISGIAAELDFIDQALAGNVDTGFPPLDAIIAAVIQQYIPPWVGDVIGVLNTAAHLFEELEAIANMTIAQDLPVDPWATETALHGTEVWSVFYVRIIDQCAQGRQTTSPVPYPQCARVPVMITNVPTPIGSGNNTVDMRVFIEPFDGVLQAGVPEADFRFDDRKIELELRKLILLALNVAVRIATNGQYQTLEAALQAALDCPGLGTRAYNLAYDFARNVLGFGNIPAVGLATAARNQVQGACNGVITNVVNAIGGIGVDWDALEFDQLGHAIDRTPQDGMNRPEELQTMARPNTIDGRFRFAISSDLGGVWSGTP